MTPDGVLEALRPLAPIVHDELDEAIAITDAHLRAVYGMGPRHWHGRTNIGRTHLGVRLERLELPDGWELRPTRNNGQLLLVNRALRLYVRIVHARRGQEAPKAQTWAQRRYQAQLSIDGLDATNIYLSWSADLDGASRFRVLRVIGKLKTRRPIVDMDFMLPRDEAGFVDLEFDDRDEPDRVQLPEDVEVAHDDLDEE